MVNVNMTEINQDITVEDLDESAKQTEEQLNLMAWKVDGDSSDLVERVNQDMCVMNLLKSVSEVRSDYHQLRRELVEVQALQRELSMRLRDQLRLVHTKFSRLRQRLVAHSNEQQR